MKASTQYNDLVGTSAADISGHTTLTEFLKEKGLNTERYIPVGAGFYLSESGGISANFFCTDEQAPKDSEQKLIRVLMPKEFTQEEFFYLFKRMEVVFFNRFTKYSELEYTEHLLSDLIG